jgi:hypothetical protein
MCRKRETRTVWETRRLIMPERKQTLTTAVGILVDNDQQTLPPVRADRP